ncbi:unnamed protein product [Lactuca virosa]|uniref:Uncharacterized protein n=1 Tax=Lactuca virosa TaxID=75947 RepID=A0AAU9MHG4_9ASTR|nr:unnamed protein product [Lactuca virosa]
MPTKCSINRLSEGWFCSSSRLFMQKHRLDCNSIDLSSTTPDVLSSELCKRLKGFLAAWPPSSPQPHVNELLIGK